MNNEFRELAINVLDIFETFLDDYDITIPDGNREFVKDEGRLFGEAYYRLEDEITELLEKRVVKIKPITIINENE